MALALRAAVACWPVLNHYDELWQYLEPAHGVVTGRWIETWDFRAGIRCWLTPLFLAGPLWVGHALSPATWLDLLFARLACAAVSLAGVAASAALGARVSRLHGLVAAFVGATWFELVWFGPRTAAEPIATALILAAAALLPGPDRRRVAAAGLLLALACAVRLQYAPAAAVIGVAGVEFAPARWRALLAGGVAGAALSAAADATMGATPFRWIARTVAINVMGGKAASFGVEPAWWYGQAYWQVWGPSLFIVLGFAAMGARRFPALLAAALVNLAAHSAIGHKEYRFVLLSTAILLLLAAIGSVDALLTLGGRRMMRRPFAILAGGWFALSALSAGLGVAATQWGVLGRLVGAWREVAAVPGLCGVAVYRPAEPLLASAALLNRDVPILQYDATDVAAARASTAFDVWLGPHAHAADLPGFTELSCDRERAYCVYRRPGGCSRRAGDARHDANLYLEQHGI